MRDMDILKSALQEAVKANDWDWPQKAVIEYPKDSKHGDLATNIAMLLTKQVGKPPREVASSIIAHLTASGFFTAEIAGPGFINVSFPLSFWQETLLYISEKNQDFGRNSFGQNRACNVEFVSANPTGPLHIGHGRGAAVGDSLTRIMRFSGYNVTTEYYTNDAGLQMRLLGLSTWLRVQELVNIPVTFPESYYRGDYIIDIAKELLEKYPELPSKANAEEICFDYAMASIFVGIKQDLKDFGVHHDVWFSERSLVEDGTVEASLKALLASDEAYNKDNACWFRSIKYGDDKDRVLCKSDGYFTYFATDIAYHKNKLDRGFVELVDIWGADHHGYIPRMKSSLKAMGYENPDEMFSVILIQLVKLLRGGLPIPMSTRSGEFVTLREVMDEVGVDSARFMFLSRKSDQPLDFDLDLVKQRSMDNPVYYVQYAHARIAAIFRRAKTQDIPTDFIAADVVHRLTDPEDILLIRACLRFESAVLDSARNKAPHIISFFLVDLASKLHSYYGKMPILIDDIELVQARLNLLNVVRFTIQNGLNLLGVSAPDSM